MRIWAEINLDNLENNLKTLKLISDQDIIAIVKANGYGHGAIEIALELEKQKIKYFGVATVSEAIELRDAGIRSKILMLGCTPIDEWKLAIKNLIDISISSFEEIEFLKKSKLSPNIHLNIDTGMGRIGFSIADFNNAITEILEKTDAEIISVYSHFSSADNDIDFTYEQLEIFMRLKKSYPQIENWHIANSAGLINNFSGTNLIRPGLFLYGLLGVETKFRENIKPVMTLKSKIVFIKIISKKSPISYSKTYWAKKGDIIATISAGYADGISRKLSNIGKVKLRGQLCDIVGNVTMDQLMIKIPNSIKDPKIGEEVIFFDESYTANDLAILINTIPYEILTGISSRVPRIYFKNKKIIKQISFLGRKIL